MDGRIHVAVEMAMLDLGYPISSGSGVAAAQEWYRSAFSDHSVDASASDESACEDVA